MLLIFVMYYFDYCEPDVNFLFLIFAVARQFKMCKQREQDRGDTWWCKHMTMMAAWWWCDGLRDTDFQWL